MAIIYTYPAGGLKSSDNFVISDGAVNDTYKLSAGALLSWIDDNLDYDLQQVLNSGSDADLDAGDWTSIKAWRDKSNQELLFYLDPTPSAQNPSGRWETHTKLEMHKGLDASATITSVDGDNLFIRSGNSASLSLQGALNVSVTADGTISHSSGGFSGTYYNNLEKSVTTGYHSTQVIDGYYKVLTVEDKQIYETSGGSAIGFEFKATPGVTTFPKLVLEDNISFHIKSKVVDSTGTTGTTDQVLKSDVNGFVSWATDEQGVPGGSSKSIQYNGGGFAGDDKFIYDSGSGRADVTMGKMGLTAGGLIIHGDNDQAYQANINMYDSKLSPNANRARIESPASYTADYDLILPVDGPSAGNSYLVSDASGNLSFNTVSPGGGASGAQYNIQISDGSSNFTSTDAFKYDTTSNNLAVGLGNNNNTIVPSITVGSTTGKSGSLSLLNKDQGKLQIEPYNGLANTVKIIFPQYNSTGNQILQSDATNQLSWIDTPTATVAAGSSGDIQFNDGSNAFAVAPTAMKLNYDSTKGSLSTQSNIGNNAAYIGSSSSTTSTQSFTENLGTMNLINNNNTGGSGQYSTVLALKTLMTTAYQANPEFITFYDSTSGGTPVGSIVYDPTGSGQIVIPTTSDERLKENKKDYDKIDAKSKIQSLKVKSYSFKEDADKKEVKGFFAQEVKEVIPEAVIGSDTDKWEDGSLKPMSLNMHAFIPYLTSALQEAHDTIDKMKQDFKTLENKVSELENSNGDLDTKIEDVKKDVSNNTGSIGGLDTKVSDIKSTADKAVVDAAEAKAVADKAKEKADTNETNIDKKADKGE